MSLSDGFIGAITAIESDIMGATMDANEIKGSFDRYLVAVDLCVRYPVEYTALTPGFQRFRQDRLADLYIRSVCELLDALMGTGAWDVVRRQAVDYGNELWNHCQLSTVGEHRRMIEVPQILRNDIQLRLCVPVTNALKIDAEYERAELEKFPEMKRGKWIELRGPDPFLRRGCYRLLLTWLGFRKPGAWHELRAELLAAIKEDVGKYDSLIRYACAFLASLRWEPQVLLDAKAASDGGYNTEPCGEGQFVDSSKQATSPKWCHSPDEPIPQGFYTIETLRDNLTRLGRAFGSTANKPVRVLRERVEESPGLYHVVRHSGHDYEVYFKTQEMYQAAKRQYDKRFRR